MNYTELKSIVNRALDKLKDRDSKLFHLDASEWAIAHRLAVYLEQELPQNWNVDCEYNRQGSEKEAKAMGDGGKIRPDIVIHHRTLLEPENNLLVIELKKREADADLMKACEYTKQPTGDRKFQYQYGLSLSVLDGPKLYWFKEGMLCDTF
jgi:hypothetical protein